MDPREQYIVPSNIVGWVPAIKKALESLLLPARREQNLLLGN